MMQLYGILWVIFLFILFLLLTIGGFIIQREKYWMRIWNEFGNPEVKDTKELKAYSNKYSCQLTAEKLDQSPLDLESE